MGSRAFLPHGARVALKKLMSMLGVCRASDVLVCPDAGGSEKVEEGKAEDGMFAQMWLRPEDLPSRSLISSLIWG